jgi:hypothetical protein
MAAAAATAASTQAAATVGRWRRQAPDPAFLASTSTRATKEAAARDHRTAQACGSNALRRRDPGVMGQDDHLCA